MRPLFEPTGPNLVEFSWRHGRFVDFWSFVHLLTGSLLGMLAWRLGLSLPATILVVAGIATVYESVEILLHVSEDAENVLTDIILTTAGGALGWHLFLAAQPGTAGALGIFSVVAIADLSLFLLGWRHYLRKKLYGE